MEKSKPTINTLAGAFAIVSKSMQTVKDEKVTIEQSIKVGCTSVFTVKYSGGKDNTEDVYSFNFGDINEQKIVLSDKSDHLKIKVPASDKFISYQQNGVRQNYTGDIEIISDNIETLRFTTAALRFAVQGCRQSIKPELYSGNFTQLIALINKQSPNFKNGREELKQGFEVIDQSLCKVKFNQLFINEKSSSDILYEFGFKDCNPESVQLSVSGKNVFVSFQTNNKEKIIKTYENGKVANYTNTVKIQVDDIERAKGLVNMMKHTMKFCRK
jgi:hypothetical protein